MLPARLLIIRPKKTGLFEIKMAPIPKLLQQKPLRQYVYSDYHGRKPENNCNYNETKYEKSTRSES